MRAHISLNVSDVGKSIEFYKLVFNASPQKETKDYAKFDLMGPALNFSLQKNTDALSRLNHLGIELDSVEEIMKWQKRLTKAGILELVESDSHCCFARQDKLWIKDPDGNSWEIFYVHEQLPVVGTHKEKGCC